MTIPDNGRHVKRTPVTDDEWVELALRNAHLLVDMGVPVFAGKLGPDGNPDTHDRRWGNWQGKKPSHRVAESFQLGEALCAVTGVTFDVLDKDPRNGGGPSFVRLAGDLGDDGPVVYWEVSTPSGGRHLYVAALGVGSRPGFLPGLDLKGGKPDGSSRGFVFIPPTIRPSKDPADDGESMYYLPRTKLIIPNGTGPSEALRDYMASSGANGRAVMVTGGSSPRRDKDAYKAECLQAGMGDQRRALMDYVQELERRGYEPDDIVTLLRDLVHEMPTYDSKRPWYPAKGRNPEAHLRGLLHKEGAVTPDARPGELDGIREPIPSGSYISADDIAEEKVDWLNKPFLPFGCLVIIDGDPGQGKSTLTTGIVARAASGLPSLPYGDSAECGPIHCGMIGAEDDIGQAVIGRLRAAGYISNRHVWFMQLKKRRGKIELLTFPDGTERVRRFINDNGLRLLVIDPVSSFLGEEIHSHNEASVRKALGPLGEIARETGCCIILVRHLNKDGSMKAMYRGGGSIAFSAIARSGLITGVAPDDSSFGIAQVKCSYAEKFPGTIKYSISRWEEDGAIAVIDWGEHDAGLDADTLARGLQKPKGPVPVTQLMISDVLSEMFRERETWPQSKCLERLRSAGCTTEHKTVDKVRERMGIRSIPSHRRGSGQFGHWDWTVRKGRVSDDE